MGACVIVAATWVEWFSQPANWLVVLQVAGGLGFVIFVHELGHFLVAKACGVKCEKFYLGFDVGGLKICSFKVGETEYGIGAVPLGGYVKMLGQDDNPAAAAQEAHRARMSGDLPAEPVAGPHPAWDPRSYPAQSVPKRMAIISAGVIMNVIFAWLMASWAFGLGVKELTCTLSSVRTGGAAWRAGLRTGDEITAIGGQEQPIFNDLKHHVTVGSVERGVEFTVHRPADDSTRKVLLRPDTDLGAPTVGVISPLSLTLRSETVKDLPGSAARAEPALAAGDEIRAVDGTAVKNYAELIAALSRVADKPVVLNVARAAAAGADGTTLDVTVPPQAVRSTGLQMTPRSIKAVQEDSPAAAAGIRAGDRLVSVDGGDVGDPLTLDERMQAKAGTRVRLELARAGGEKYSVDIEPRPVTWRDDELSGLAMPVSVASVGLAITVDATVAAATGPAATAGIVAGERVTRVRFLEPVAKDAASKKPAADEGVELSDKMPNWPGVMAILQQVPAGTKLELTVADAAGTERPVEIEPIEVTTGFVVDRGLILEPVYTLVQAGSAAAALRKGAGKAVQDLSLVYGFLRKLTSNQISPRLLGGPIEIAKQAGRSAQEGFSQLLLFLTMLSANLAVVNFLPIPVLDGGHMVFLLYELVRGKPPSENVVAALSYVGLALLLTLMMFVFGLDLGLIPRR